MQGLMAYSNQRSTPRMRGSTPLCGSLPGKDRVYPAHAGIDPLGRGGMTMTMSLPRACGDRPSTYCAQDALARSTPRMRGSTQGAPLEPIGDYVYPAHAGIDRW